VKGAVVNMAQKEYTHIRVSKELHGVLKSEADRAGISISGYIAELLRRNQALETLMAGVSDVNMSGDTGKASLAAKKLKKRCSAGDLNPGRGLERPA
jgi:hypothetical protein